MRSIQFLDGQNGVAVSAVGILGHQSDGDGSAVDGDDRSAGEGLLIGGRTDGNGRTGSGDGIAVQFQPQGYGEGRACAGGNHGVVFDLIDAGFRQDKFRCACRMGNGCACLGLGDGEGQGCACGCGHLLIHIGGAVQVQGSGCACGACGTCRDILLYTTEKSFIYQYL